MSATENAVTFYSIHPDGSREAHESADAAVRAVRLGEPGGYSEDADRFVLSVNVRPGDQSGAMMRWARAHNERRYEKLGRKPWWTTMERKTRNRKQQLGRWR